MKTKHILIGFLFLFSITMSGQTEVPIENREKIKSLTGKYFKDVNGHYNKFIGTWEYSDNNTYFKVQFYKVSKISIPHLKFSFYDRLASFIEYKEKQDGQWVTIYNTFGTSAIRNNNYYDSRVIIKGGEMISPNELTLNYTEPSDDCRYQGPLLSVKYQKGSSMQLLWERDPLITVTGPFLCPHGELIDDNPFKIPAHMVLTKVSH